MSHFKQWSLKALSSCWAKELQEFIMLFCDWLFWFCRRYFLTNSLHELINCRVLSLKLKGHSQLWDDCTDLDTRFLTLKKFTPTWNKSSLRNPLQFSKCFAWFSIVYWKTCFWVSFCSSYDIIFITYGSVFIAFLLCKLAMKCYLLHICARWLCPFKIREIFMGEVTVTKFWSLELDFCHRQSGIFLGQFCPRGKDAMKLTLCEAPTHHTPGSVCDKNSSSTLSNLLTFRDHSLKIYVCRLLCFLLGLQTFCVHLNLMMYIKALVNKNLSNLALV